MLYEIDGKIIIGKGDALPARCPECRRIIESRREAGPKFECPFCHYNGATKEFLGTEFHFLCDARILVPIG